MTRHRSHGVQLLLLAALIAFACFYTRQAIAPISASAMTQDMPVTFLAVGDIMISRGVARAIDRANDPLAPFRRMDPIFRSTDFNFGNLESPISPNGNIIGKGLVFNARRRDVAGLREYNFQVLNIANNHALDQGLAGLRNTRQVLADNGLTPLGAGDDLADAWTPKITEVRGIKIGFVGASYSSNNDNGASRNDHVARIEDTERLRQAIDELKQVGTHFIVATMHAGTEYVRNPNASQISFARSAIDLGADVVIGTHPHWIQTIERYKGKLIFHSLGNFVFDQEWSQETKEGLALKITIIPDNTAKQPAATIEQVELIPVIIENYSTPRPANEIESRVILGKINENSRTIRPMSERVAGSQ
ncbi:MAG TPA: CapA family protein [Pyrinomonadaceae bacterium]|nr:CapA family protein [Pyrinomonadaceae bacterium]